MAKGRVQETTEKTKEEITENLYNAKALVYIKYDNENYKPGDEFEVRESDVKELEENGYAEVDDTRLNTPVEPPINPDGGDGGQDGGNGGE